MAQVASTDGSDIQALAPRRRFPSLSYLADGSGVGQDVQSVLQGIADVSYGLAGLPGAHVPLC